ncbi:hypothetical protein KAT82_03815, partial [bacterium]|nr:hypothetical protein [bacterium]
VPCLAQADIAEIMSYQGVLRDGSGNPVPDGSYDVTFRIYDVETAGTALWTENQTLTATGGIINAHLGSVTDLTTLGFDVPYWLGISVEGGAELVPRTAFTTVPYAAHAGFADTCLEGDSDWQYDGDNIYHDVGNVGIGTVTPAVKLDVAAGDARCARFENDSGGNRFTVMAVNNGGNTGGFFSGIEPSWYPAVPTAVYGKAGLGSRGAHFASEDSDALFAYSADARAVWGRSATDYAGYFDGGGLGVYIDDQLETNAFRMAPGAASGYVLTSDVDGISSWQPGGGGSDGDWTIAGSDMYSGVSGRVGIGTTLPTAKLEIYNETADEALEVKYGGATASRVVNIERTSLPGSYNDLLQLKIPTGSPDNCQFIEAEYGATVNFSVDGDGSIMSRGTLDVYGSDENQAEFSSNSVTATTKVVSGIATGTGYDDPVGVYGESVPNDYYGIGGSFLGGYYGVHGRVVSTGGDFYRGVYGRVTGGTGDNIGIYGTATGDGTNYGVYGVATVGTGYAGYFVGNAHVTGTFTAGVKSFKIDHPLDPANKYLVHSCVESDEMMNIYNGNVTLDARGEASVEMPDWFEALNQDFRYQLTAIGAPGPNLYVAEEISGNRFLLAGGEPGMKVSWQVTGVRHDPLAVASRMLVEQDKPANEVGKYMHPEAYGMPVTAGVDYHEERELAASSGRTERRPLEAFDPNDGE